MLSRVAGLRLNNKESEWVCVVERREHREQSQAREAAGRLLSDWDLYQASLRAKVPTNVSVKHSHQTCQSLRNTLFKEIITNKVPF